MGFEGDKVTCAFAELCLVKVACMRRKFMRSIESWLDKEFSTPKLAFAFGAGN